LFLSTKTIEAHLHRTYRKLGISTRNELAPLLAARTPEPRTHDTAAQAQTRASNGSAMLSR
jgi:hypothetical protein